MNCNTIKNGAQEILSSSATSNTATSSLHRYLSKTLRPQLAQRAELKSLIAPAPPSHHHHPPTCLAQLVCCLPRYGVGMRLVDIDELDPIWRNRSLLLTRVQFRPTRLMALDKQGLSSVKDDCSTPKESTTSTFESSESDDFAAALFGQECNDGERLAEWNHAIPPLQPDPAELAAILQVKPNRHYLQYRVSPLTISGILCELDGGKQIRPVNLNVREKYGIRWGVL